MKNLIFLDTETTGNEVDRDRLVEVCYKIRGDEDIHTELFKPPLPMSVKSMSVTHITNKMLEDKPTFEGTDFQKTLQQLLQTHTLVAHNAPFDIAILKNDNVETPSFVDTLRVARHLDQDAVIPEYNLQYLRYYLGIEIPDAKAHDAESDVRVLEALFERLLEKVKTDTKGDETQAINTMIEISRTPTLMKKFTFGKYAGELVEKIAQEDRGYLDWLYTQKSQDPSVTEEDDWFYTLKHYLHN